MPKYNRMHRFIILILISGALIQCKPRTTVTGPSAPSSSAVSRTPDLPTVDFTVGSLTEGGRLNFWSIDAFDHIQPFVLKGDYGVVLYNAGSDSEPIACFVVAMQATRTIIHTTDYQIFKDAIARIPRGSTVANFHTCSMPMSHGLLDEDINKFESVLSGAELIITDEEVCYCPNKN